MQRFTHRVAQEPFSILRAEHQMNMHARERLRHERIPDPDAPCGHEPIRVRPFYRGICAGSRISRRPEGAQYESPGLRPGGKRSTQSSIQDRATKALKGRHNDSRRSRPYRASDHRTVPRYPDVGLRFRFSPLQGASPSQRVSARLRPSTLVQLIPPASPHCSPPAHVSAWCG